MNRMHLYHFRLGVVICAILCSMLTATAHAREISDMAARKVVIPDKIEHIYAMSHAFPLIVAIAPDLLAGMGFPVAPSPEVLHYYPRGLAKLPLLGIGSDANLEKLKAIGVDITFGWPSPQESFPVKKFERINVPVVFINVDRLDQYPGSFRFLGQILHREARASQLAKKLEDTVAYVRNKTASIGVASRPRVYYAESIDGLTSQCDASPRSEIIALAGGRNAVHCDAKSLLVDHYTMDLEALIAVNPDVIVTRFAHTAETIRTDPRWRQLKAVREGKVYAAPALPFNWIDRPPSFMRAMGAMWLASKLHPDLHFDLKRQTRDFYRVFFGYTLSDADLEKLLSP